MVVTQVCLCILVFGQDGILTFRMARCFSLLINISKSVSVAFLSDPGELMTSRL